VTLRQGIKPHGFFGLSSVRDLLRNAAWPRLGAYRSGGGKARKQYLHSDGLFPGRCHARGWFRAPCKGKNGPQLAVGVLETRHTRIFRCLPWGMYPPGWRLFLMLFSTLWHFLKPMLLCSSYLRTAQSVYIWNNAVAFLRMALRHATHTLFCFQGARCIFSQRNKKVETYGLKPGTPNCCLSRGAACGGLKPFSVRGLGRGIGMKRVFWVVFRGCACLTLVEHTFRLCVAMVLSASWPFQQLTHAPCARRKRGGDRGMTTSSEGLDRYRQEVPTDTCSSCRTWKIPASFRGAKVVGEPQGQRRWSVVQVGCYSDRQG
jgi:hypothetical protein